MSQIFDIGLMVEVTPRGNPRLVLYNKRDFSLISTLPLEDIFEAWDKFERNKDDFGL